MCLHELSLEDNTLEALGTPKEYQQLRNWIIQIIIGWIVFIFSQLLAIASRWKFVFTSSMNYYDILEISLRNYPIFVNVLNVLIWGSILGLVYTMWSQNDRQIFRALKEPTKLSRKILYHFAIFAIIIFNQILIIKNRRILVFNNFLLKYYQLYRKTSNKNCLFSFHRFLQKNSHFQWNLAGL